MASNTATRVSSNMIGAYQSMAEMLASCNPARSGETYYLAQYYADYIGRGAGQFVSVADTTTVDDGGFTNVRVNPQYILQRVGNYGSVSIYDGGGRSTTGFNNAPIFQRYFDTTRGRPLELSRGVFEFHWGVVIRANKGISIFHEGTMDGQCVLQFIFADGDTNSQAAIRLEGSPSDFTYSGINMRGFKVLGNNKAMPDGSARHGIDLQYAAYPNLRDLQVNSFRGSGLLLDRVQDGPISNLNIQQCGHSTCDYTVLADVTDSSKTDYAALEILSTQSGDQSNMLRIDGLQIEHNHCTPYVRVRGGIGIRINNIHAEHRQGIMAGKKAGTFLQMYTAEVSMSDVQASEFEWAATTRGYGRIEFSGWGRSGGLKSEQAGGNCYWQATNCNFDKIVADASVQFQFTNVSVRSSAAVDGGTFRWSWPGQIGSFLGCQLGDFICTPAAHTSTFQVRFTGCGFNSVDCTAVGMSFSGGTCSGNFRYRPPGGANSVVYVNIVGTIDIQKNYGTTYIPGPQSSSVVWGDGEAPTTGFNMKVGSRWINQTAAVDGDVVEQVLTPTGWRVTSRVGNTGPWGFRPNAFTKATLPSASAAARSIVWCTDAEPAQFVYSDGTTWRRLQDISAV